MGDKAKGLFQKFVVRRADGKDAKGQKHFGCEYFVLDVTHDPFAIPALKAYADACRTEYPLLARDIDFKIATLDPSFQPMEVLQTKKPVGRGTQIPNPKAHDIGSGCP